MDVCGCSLRFPFRFHRMGNASDEDVVAHRWDLRKDFQLNIKTPAICQFVNLIPTEKEWNTSHLINRLLI